MKAQMKFQKILSLVTLIVAAIVFVYALCFFSGNLSDLMYYYGKAVDYDITAADPFLKPGQDFVSFMVTLSIIFFVVIAVVYITGTNKRRNYYITNYIASGLIIAMCAFVALYGLIMLTVLLVDFKSLDWDAIMEYYASNKDFGAPQPSQSLTIFIIGYFVYIIVLVDTVAWILNLIWKLKLMRGERELLANGLVKEVA
jgi:cytochrome c biogenesis protein CcdA